MDFSFVQITDHHLTESESELLQGFSPGHAFRMVLRHIAQNVGEQADYQRLKAQGVFFRSEPQKAGPSMTALFEDSCGNLINLVQLP
jgi:hypothetical protein